MSEATAWLTGATREQRRSLAAASLGWMLDSMDVMLYALVLGAVAREMHLSAAAAGAMMSATLVSAAVGGIGFGWFADRFGRVRALTWSVAIYSVATGLCGLARTPAELAACRVLLGLGMGGEWAAGAALVAETWPARHRAKALALVQSSWAVGYGLGAAVVAVVMPRWGWRAVFFAGVAPALMALWVRRGLREPETWRRERGARVPMAELFRGELGRGMAVCAGMNAATLFAWWGLFTWVPHFLSLSVAEGGRGLSIVETSTWTMAMQGGAFLGYVSYGFLADRFGRKRVYIAYLGMAAAMAPMFALVRDPHALLAVGPLVGFFGTGCFSGFSVIASELFPAAVRGSALGFAYNVGRVTSAAAPWLVGAVSERSGFTVALSMTAGAYLLAAAIAGALPGATSRAVEGR